MRKTVNNLKTWSISSYLHNWSSLKWIRETGRWPLNRKVSMGISLTVDGWILDKKGKYVICLYTEQCIPGSNLKNLKRSFFEERGKQQKTETTNNTAHIWRRVRESYEALLGSKLENRLPVCYGVWYFIRPNCRIMLERCMELCSALLTSIKKGNSVLLELCWEYFTYS